ncbi:hypothetical protein G6O69_18455 [Pseudenhygromyxa sp. WMMC2535]|uniref:hypothetical protein n=1 Tax=Pseudenhygromyxa sp. WMMC2535 TaxID=2712867 RepID=UPI001596322F|nr:hypothetical protein [Pseudenhygromyxa sp. WMMC2535]NVB39831.1 hypothetical protein [Pseudenhygromyxa sp. WMMC2535]
MRAAQARRERESRAAADRAREQLRASERRVSQLRSELRTSEANTERQARVNAQLGEEVRNLERLQNRLAREQEAMDRRLTRSIQQVRNEAAKNRADLSQLERAHERHVVEVNQTFANVRQEVSDGFARASREREQMRAEYNAKIASVEADLERERQARLQRLATDQARASETLTSAGQLLDAAEQDWERADLGEDAHEIRENLAHAHGELAADSPTAALSTAIQALTKSRALTKMSRDRRARMSATRQNMLARIEQLRVSTDDARLKTWFTLELTRIDRMLNRLQRRVESSYEKWSQVEVDAREHEKIVERLQDAVEMMLTNVDNIIEQNEQRRQIGARLISSLNQLMGPAFEAPNDSQSVPGDYKSTAMLTCNYGGPKVLLHLPLEGGFGVDAFGFGSNADCHAMGKALARELRAEFGHVEEPTLSGQNRTTPELAVNTETEWQQISTILANAERDV